MFGRIDAIKLRSSLTLFAAAGAGWLCDTALSPWGGGPDSATIRLFKAKA